MKRIAAALAALVLLGPALASAEDAATDFTQKCASCHGKDGKGSPVGKKMGAPDLTTLKASEKEIAGSIENGKGKMPAYKGRLSKDQIDALAKYIKAGMK